MAIERNSAPGAAASPRHVAVACAIFMLLPGISLADSMRCGNRIVKDGDTIEKVLDVCGEPVTKERTWIQRAPQYELGGTYYSFPGTEEVPVDLWTYDFGSNKLMRRVRFVDGLVVSIVELGKGA
jgi:hypothetical protein